MEENGVKSTCGGTRLEFKVENFLIENLTRRKVLFLNLTRCIFSIQSLGRCIFFNSKSDALFFFQFKI